MAKHRPENGKCRWCYEAWPCATDQRKAPLRAAHAAAIVAKAKEHDRREENQQQWRQKLRPEPDLALTMRHVVADVDKRGPSEIEDIITRVFVEHDGTTRHIRHAIKTALAKGMVQLVDGKVAPATVYAYEPRTSLQAELGEVARFRCTLVRVVERNGAS